MADNVYSIRYKSPVKTRGRTVYHVTHIKAPTMEVARRKFRKETPLLTISGIKRIKKFHSIKGFL